MDETPETIHAVDIPPVPTFDEALEASQRIYDPDLGRFGGEDAVTLARFVQSLAQSPDAAARADDEMAIDKDWLQVISGRLIPGLGYVLSDDFCVMDSSKGWHLMIRMFEKGDVIDEETDPMRLVAVKTRGQLVGLCKYLGITLK